MKERGPARTVHYRLGRVRTRAVIILVLALFSLQMIGYPVGMTSSYANSNNGIPNIQATFSVKGGALDPSGACVRNAQYNNDHSESWLAVDPRNPQHLVGLSKFFYDPEHYLFHVGASVSNNGGLSWRNGIIPGFDCRSAPGNSWSSTTDPVVAFDSKGNLYSAVLAFTLTYNSTGDQISCCPADEMAVAKSTDGGIHWTVANGGQPIAFYPTPDISPDKQWIAVDSNPDSPLRDNVYVAWTVFDNNGSEIWFSVSRDGGDHFSSPVMISNPQKDGPFNTYVMMGVGRQGTLYAAYTSFPNPTPQADVWVLTSNNGGTTWSQPVLAASFTTIATLDLPNTTFRDGISDNFAVDPVTSHLYLALEVGGSSGLDVQLTSSSDGGQTWTKPVYVNDASTVNDGTDQFQPTVAANNGIVAVAFYDRRLACPTGNSNILAADAGRANFCINTSIQFYKDQKHGLQPLGSNIRVSRNTWDPQNPGETTNQLPRPGGPNGNETFIGDYFGLAITGRTAYVLSASTYNLGHNAAHNQEQILAIVTTSTTEE